jgi:hypothetical protein
MRIPFIRRKPLTFSEEVARSTIIPSREAAMPRLRDSRTLEQIRADAARRRAAIRANGDSPS